jgi:hypothetical protein
MGLRLEGLFPDPPASRGNKSPGYPEKSLESENVFAEHKHLMSEYYEKLINDRDNSSEHQSWLPRRNSEQIAVTTSTVEPAMVKQTSKPHLSMNPPIIGAKTAPVYCMLK